MGDLTEFQMAKRRKEKIVRRWQHLSISTKLFHSGITLAGILILSTGIGVFLNILGFVESSNIRWDIALALIGLWMFVHPWWQSAVVRVEGDDGT
jgi:hypothetical protein